MRWLVDTNVLLRSAQTSHPMYGDVARSVSALATRGDELRVVADTADILPEWEQLVVKHQVLGKQAHDARLVAAMNVHNVTNLLTFNTADFKRYDQITAVSPSSVT